MQNYPRRTDLAVESAVGGTAARGITHRTDSSSGFEVTTVIIGTGEGAALAGKPLGRYVTVGTDRLLRRGDGAFAAAAGVIAGELRGLLALSETDSVLVAGLGNPAIAADSVGALSCDSVLATAHLVETEPERFGFFRRVYAERPGVVGSTGVESSRAVKALAAELKPDRVIVIDALSSLSPARVCRTVQLTDAGIVPGSGVGNSRPRISRETLGIPVIAIGVPTVIDAETLARDLLGRAGLEDFDLPDGAFGENLIVTPRDIDAAAASAAKLIGYAINLALHSGLTADDVTALLG
ncbi:MAG: GPR endopeptidase [Oscillospiraceae bacterium]|jgi:spore protease|nr:GPR endopeptidase [Oscillospiraceae bacterium]